MVGFVELHYYLYPFIGRINLLLLLFLIIINRKYLITHSKINKRHIVFILCIILLLGILLRILFSPWNHIVYFDEWDYMEGAKAILHENMFTYCNDGTLTDCHELLNQPHPIGYPLILSLFFYIFGAISLVAKMTNFIFSILSIYLIFLCSKELFNDEKKALLASFLLSINPAHILYSTNASSETVSVFFILLSLFFLFISSKYRTFYLRTLSIAALTFTITIRPENIIYIPLYLLYIFLNNKKKIKDSVFILFLLALFLIIFDSIHFYHLAISKKMWITNQLFFSSSNILYNLKGFLLQGITPYLLITFLLTTFTLLMNRNFNKKIVFILLYVFSLLLMFLFYSYLENYVRYALPIIVPLILFSANFPLFHNRSTILKIVSIMIVFLLLTISLYSLMSLIKYNPLLYSKNAYHPSLEIIQLIKKEYNSSIIVTTNPFFISFELNQYSVHPSNKQRIDSFIEANKSVLLYENVFCDETFWRANKNCIELKRTYKTKILFENNRTREVAKLLKIEKR